MQLFGPVVYGWCVRARLQPADAEDVTQDVFQRVATHLEGFRRDRPGDSFRGWLWMITRHRIIDFVRHRGEGPAEIKGAAICWEQIPDELTDGSWDNAAVGERQTLCLRVLEYIRPEFEPQTWRAFWLVAVEGRPPADVAAELQVTTNAVYIAKSRVFRRLRDELE